MGSTSSRLRNSIAAPLRRLLEILRRVFRSNKMGRNPAMEEMEGLMARHRQTESDTEGAQRPTEVDATEMDEIDAEGGSGGTIERTTEWPEARRTGQHSGWRTATQRLPIPTPEQYAAAQQRVQYVEGLLHIAITGVSGSGKSSLLNALLGLQNGAEGAAAVGTSETTATIARYPDPQPDNPFVYYDVPGAGTLRVTGQQYFLNQELYVFDAVIIVLGDRVTEIDIEILRSCRLMDVPTYVVRSKALQHIRNLMSDMDPTCTIDRDMLVQKARASFIQSTQKSVVRNLEEAGLPSQRVYIVDKEILCPIVSGQDMSYYNSFDEWALLYAILNDARNRRVIQYDDYSIPDFLGGIDTNPFL
ncbi:P-loop containing nucleoside triphosphate hydrolase protein [Fomitopsis betulina]|nr:P-loop containing nucleoside triphosphate hydrolase protein [Fomitopsis betulina]